MSCQRPVNIKGDGMMDAQVLNFKAYSSGAMVGFFVLAVAGIVVTGCKAFRKDDKTWFAWPSEKTTDAAGEVKYRDIVSAAEPIMRHLQGLVRGQLRAALDATPAATNPPASRPSRKPGGYKTPEGEDLSQYRTNQGADDIPF